MRPYAVGIPTYNRFDLLAASVAAWRAAVEPPAYLLVVDNSAGRCPPVGGAQLIVPRRNLGVAASWNLLLKLTDPLPCVLANDDLAISPGTPTLLLDSAHHACCTLAGHGFSCFLPRRDVLADVGSFDEQFWPAYFDDSDWQWRFRLKGYEFCDVPGTADNFGGSCTRAAMTPDELAWLEEGLRRSRDYYTAKWGAWPPNEYHPVPFGAREVTAGQERSCEYAQRCTRESDIYKHLPTLRRLATHCQHVTEFGTRTANSTWAFLHAQPDELVCYDVAPCPCWAQLERCRGRTRVVFRQQDTRAADINPTDLLFVDTDHTVDQVRAELERAHHRVRQFIVFHDTVTFWDTGTDGGPGIGHAIDPFLRAHPEWQVRERYEHNNGLLVVSRHD